MSPKTAGAVVKYLAVYVYNMWQLALQHCSCSLNRVFQKTTAVRVARLLGMSVMLNLNKLPATSHTSTGCADKLFQLACGSVIYLKNLTHYHLKLPDVLQAQLE